MRGADFKKLIFNLNLLTTLLVFIVLTPSVRIYASWFPDKKDSLWLLPLGVVGVRSFLWFLTSLSLPVLIRWRIVKDLRKSERGQGETVYWVRVFNAALPVVLFGIIMILLIIFSAALVHFMKSGHLQDLFVNLPK